MHNPNSKDECESSKSKPRIIKKFEKRPPLKVSKKAQPSEGKSSTIEEKVNIPESVAEVAKSNGDLQYEKNLFKNESNRPLSTLKNNLSCTQDKYESSSGKSSNGSNANAMPANRRLSSLVIRLKQLQVESNIAPQEGVNSHKNLLSTDKIENNNKTSGLNNKLSSNVMNRASNQVNGSQDKDQLWSLSSTIWSPDIQVKSKEISCALSLEGTLILTNTYSGSLCSTKEYSKPTLLKPLNSTKDSNWSLSNKIWSANQVLLENNSNFLTSRADSTAPNENGIPSELKAESSLQASEKENNLFKPSQASVQQDGEPQWAGECNNNKTTASSKKSRMSILLERLRSEAESTSPPPKPLSNQGSPTASSSPPCKSKSSPSLGARSAPAGRNKQRGSCYNCGVDGHRFYECPLPLTRSFCHRCGWEDVSNETCPFCTGTLVRPGSTTPVPVGGDARKKFPGVKMDAKRERTQSRERRSQ